MDISEECDEFVDEWDRRRRMAAQLVASLVCYYRICMHGNNVDCLIRPSDQNEDRERRRIDLMDKIRSSDIDQMATQEFVVLQGVNGVNDEQTSPTTSHEATSEELNKSTTSSNSKKRGATSLLDGKKLNKAVKRIAVPMEKGNEILKERNDILKMIQPHVHKEEEVYDELMRLGFDGETCIKGYNFLIENPAKARAFFSCPIEVRVKFLISQMQSAGVV